MLLNSGQLLNSFSPEILDGLGASWTILRRRSIGMPIGTCEKELLHPVWDEFMLLKSTAAGLSYISILSQLFPNPDCFTCN